MTAAADLDIRWFEEPVSSDDLDGRLPAGRRLPLRRSRTSATWSGFHHHGRIESMFFDGTLDPAGGVIRAAPDRPGLGLEFRAADAEKYRTT